MLTPIRSATRARRSSASSPRARRGTTPACAWASRRPASSSAAAAAASTSASGNTRTSSRAAASTSRPTPSPSDLRHGVERDLDLARPARHQPRVVDRLHELDRRDRLRGDAAAAGEADVLLSGGTDGCVLPGMIFGFSRMRAVSTHYNDRPERGLAAVRSRPRRLRARRRRVDGGARARGRGPARAARASTRRSTGTRRRATPIIACRWIPTASRSCAA